MIDVNNSKSLPMRDEIALAEHDGVPLAMFKAKTLFLGKRFGEGHYASLLVDPVDYYTAHFHGRAVFRYIQSHPDLDHMSGLCRIFWQEQVPLANVWDTTHEKTFTKQDFNGGPYDWNDWLVYQRMRSGKVRDDDRHEVLHKYLGDNGEYWTEDGIRILSPTDDLINYCNRQDEWNNASYILRVDFGGRHVILPGDAERPAWDSVERTLGRSTSRVTS